MRTNRICNVGCWAVVTIALLISKTNAANISWGVDGNGNWWDVSNWVSGVIPGVSDNAVFSQTLTASRTITASSPQAIGGIKFKNSSTHGYVVSGGPLLLASGGSVESQTGNGKHADVVNADIVLQGDGNTANFKSGAVQSQLVVSGSVSGSASSGHTTTLTLSGYANPDTVNLLSGTLNDGVGGGKLALFKVDATNTWAITGDNSFSGGVTVDAGVLVVGHANALGSHDIVRQSTNGTVALSGGITVTGKTIELGGTTLSTIGGLDSIDGVNVWDGNATFSNKNNGARINVKTGKLIIKGDLYVDSASGNPTLGGYGEGEIHGVINGNASKTLFRSSVDTGSWAFLNTNTFGGNITCANGSIIINNDKSLGAKATKAAAGLTLGAAAVRGTLRAIADANIHENYGVTLHGGGGCFECDEGVTLTINGAIINRAATPTGTLWKKGKGTLTLTGVNTFNTMFEILEGTTKIAHANALQGLGGAQAEAGLRVDGALDLSGNSLSVNCFYSSGGTVTNGTLSILKQTALAGDNTAATVILPTTSLAGAVALDVFADGSSDKLVVNGNLNLGNVTLAIPDGSQMRSSKVYTIAECSSGVISGTFTSTELPANWRIKYESNRITLFYFAGLIMTLQ